MNRKEQRRRWQGLYERYGTRVVGPMTEANYAEFAEETGRTIDFFRNTLEPFIQRTGGNPAVLVDYGCGYGRYSLYLSRRCLHYEGVDIAPFALERAHMLMDGVGKGILNFRTVEEFQDYPGFADLVFTNAVLQHNDDAMFREVASLIRTTRPQRLWFHEQSDPDQCGGGNGCWGRSLEMFQEAFSGYHLTETRRTARGGGKWHSVFSGVRKGNVMLEKLFFADHAPSSRKELSQVP